MNTNGFTVLDKNGDISARFDSLPEARQWAKDINGILRTSVQEDCATRETLTPQADVAREERVTTRDGLHQDMLDAMRAESEHRDLERLMGCTCDMFGQPLR